MSRGLGDDSLQWCHENYKVIYSCITHLKQQQSSRSSDESRHGTPKRPTVPLGFWDKLWGNAEHAAPDPIHSKDHYLLGDIGHYDQFVDASMEEEQESVSKTNTELKRGLRESLENGFFNRPNFIPRRINTLHVSDLLKYMHDNYTSLRDHVYQVDAFSLLANVDQMLACELLCLGILHHGPDCHGMTEGMVMLSMLRLQSQYQWRCYTELLASVAACEDETDTDDFGKDAVDIMRSLVSKGLIDNACKLLLGAVKEAARYYYIMNSQEPKLGRLLYDFALEVIDSVVNFLELYFMNFHATLEQLSSLLWLVPHVFGSICDVVAFNAQHGNHQAPDDTQRCAWYVQSSQVSTSVSIAEFENISQHGCNVSARISLVIALVLSPNFKRLSPNLHYSHKRTASTEMLSKIKQQCPFGSYNQLEEALEFMISIFHKNVPQCINFLNENVTSVIKKHFIDAVSTRRSRNSKRILALILIDFVWDSDGNGRCSQAWRDMIDFELRSKQQLEAHCKEPYVQDDSVQLFRQPGKMIIDLLELFQHFIESAPLEVLYGIWCSSCEVYMFVIPQAPFRLQKYNEFTNSNYNGPDVKALDVKTRDRLIYPTQGRCWYNRNCALLEITTTAATDARVFIETYPRLLTCILIFGAKLAHAGMSKEVAQFITFQAYKDIRLPLLMERILYQLGNLARSDYDRLADLIYQRVLVRDDQIETAAATLEIASSISGSSIDAADTGMSKMYTFPLIGGAVEVRIALCMLGLGGKCPFGLLETSHALFGLVASCVGTPALCNSANPQRQSGVMIEMDVIFSILNSRFFEGMESTCVALLDLLGSGHGILHAKDKEMTKRVLLTLDILADMLNRNDGSLLGRGLGNLTSRELTCLFNCIDALLNKIPKSQRFTKTSTDCLLQLVEVALQVLRAQFPNPESDPTDWSLVSSILKVLYTIAKGPVIPSYQQTRASVFLLEQLLSPASSCLVLVLRTANVLPEAIHLLYLLLKRDALVSISASVHAKSASFPTCPSCNLPMECMDEDDFQTLQPPTSGETRSNESQSWWANKIRNINGNLFSSRSIEQGIQVCSCIANIKGGPSSLSSLVLAHEAILQASSLIQKPTERALLNIGLDFIAPSDLDNFGKYKQHRMTSLLVLLLLLQRLGPDGIHLSSRVYNELRQVYFQAQTCPEERINFDLQDMDPDDLILYNACSLRCDLLDQNGYHFNLGRLAHLIRAGYDNVVMYMLRVAGSGLKLDDPRTLPRQLLGSECEVTALVNLAMGGTLWRFNDQRRLDALVALLRFAKVPSVARHVLMLWPHICEVEQLLMDMSRLPFDALILQCQRLTYTLQLIMLLVDHGPCVLDVDALVKFYGMFAKIFCDSFQSLELELRRKWDLIHDGLGGVERLVRLYKSCAFTCSVCETSVVLETTCLGIDAVNHLDPALVPFAKMANRNNWFVTSAIGLLSTILWLLPLCTKFGVVNIAEKSKTWLEWAGADFNPEERSDLRTTLQLSLIKTLADVWGKCSMHKQESSMAMTTVNKLAEFLINGTHTPELRGKVYKSLGTISEYRGPQIIARYCFGFKGLNLCKNNAGLLQLLFSDAVRKGPTCCLGLGDNRNSQSIVACNSLGSSDNARLLIGSSFFQIPWSVALGKGINELFDLAHAESTESIYRAAEYGALVDYRIESLRLLAFIIHGLQNVQASTVDMDVCTLGFGALGIVSTGELAVLVKANLYNVGSLQKATCTRCLEMVTQTCKILRAASGLQQFTAFWHATRTSAGPCLADLVFASDLLASLKPSVISLELVENVVVMLENILNVPSTRTRNGLIAWLNKHAEALMLVVNDHNFDTLPILASLLRIHRICTLWLLAEHRHKTQERLEFSLVYAKVQCSFTLASCLLPVACTLLQQLLERMDTATQSHWQCILLILQSMMPELGAFEGLEFTIASTTRNAALVRLPLAIQALETCGAKLYLVLRQLLNQNSLGSMGLSGFALQCATVECAATLVAHVLSLTLPPANTLDGVSILLDNIFQVTSGFKVGFVHAINSMHSMHSMHAMQEGVIEHLSPDDLEQVPFTRATATIKSSRRSIVASLCASLWNLKAVMGRAA
ncbi:hypothetical protein BdWA1_002488 [Babesia duncani]|uniref:Uncharacterized protein n=1 Tax=Babesia duncani TaxID=323732 RepID=A0AAD9PJ97_9APIC|nr:hypothetical protein BdWA1_002488 [Babesia duncani]